MTFIEVERKDLINPQFFIAQALYRCINSATTAYFVLKSPDGWLQGSIQNLDFCTLMDYGIMGGAVGWLRFNGAI